MSRFMLLAAAWALAFGLAGATAHADTVYVCWDGSGDYLTIQEGIDAANDGDEVVVCDGTYTGPLNKNLDFGGTLITVRSEFGPDNCIIDCENDGRGFYLHSGETGEAVVDGITVRRGSALVGGGILCEASSPTLQNCVLTANSSTSSDYGDGGGGICCRAGGSPTLANCALTANSSIRGGGMFCFESSATLTDCTISDNTAERGGGGVNCWGSSLTLTNCTVSGNTGTGGSGGLLVKLSSSVTLTDCTISGNTAQTHGGGMNCADSSATLTDCTISGNRAVDGFGGGIDCDNSTLTNCTISDNTAGNGGGGIAGNNLSLTNCTISGNVAPRLAGGIWCGYSTLTHCTITGNTCAEHAGGINCNDSTLTHCTITGNTCADGAGGVRCDEETSLTNCTITANTADGNGGGVVCGMYSTTTLTNCTIAANWAANGRALACAYPGYPGDVTITNSILWNGGDEIWNGDGRSTITVTYSDVQGGWPDEGNIDADPLFADPNNADYHLSPGSPCINAGSNYAPDLPDEDIEGNARIQHCRVDMGAYESPYAGTFEDCNENGEDDDCDVYEGTSEDYDLNGVPDECDPDCNENGIPDACDLDCATGDCASHPLGCGGSADCQANGVPDECDIADGSSDDYDLNGVPDECDPDCNENGIPDACDADCGTGDCASSPLGCGTSEDCNENGIPDECINLENDCNGNEIPDECDIADGTSRDFNANGIPDECECLGDLDGDWDVDLIDLATLLSNYGDSGGVEYHQGDIDGDDDIDLTDLAALLSVYGTTCP